MSTDYLQDPTGENRDWAPLSSPDAIKPAAPDSDDLAGDEPEGLDDGETDLLTDGELAETPPILGNLR